MLPQFQNRSSSSSSGVLLVCIYNQLGNIITHDYLYGLFSPYGAITKILIFEKARVWKSFVEFSDPYCAGIAIAALNNKIIFEDGSKMNIFRSKLKHVQLQNANLGGVDYKDLEEQQSQIRRRNSTFQDHTHEVKPHSGNHYLFAPTFPDRDFDSSVSGNLPSSSENSGRKSAIIQHVDEKFREIIMESGENYQEWQTCWKEIEQKSCHDQELNVWKEAGSEKQETMESRKKSKTIVSPIVNPNSEQFLLENSPSKVLFIRSIPPKYTNICIYNIFSNFGHILKVIYIRDKNSALVQFDQTQSAIKAKDELNYAKADCKVFYSHYETLVLREGTEDEEVYDYHSEVSRHSGVNPPTNVLYLTMVSPQSEEEIQQICESMDCNVTGFQWRQNGKDKWMCLLEFQDLRTSLFVMGNLQGRQLSTGQKIKLSFTRSKLRKIRGREQSI